MVDGWTVVQYSEGMEFTDWMWIKFGVFVFLAFLYGIWKGFTER